MHDSPTLDAFAGEIWAPRARRRLAAKTWERDSLVYRKHIRPLLGNRPIGSLDVEDLVEWQDRLEESGIGTPTLVKAIGILSSVFREAARRPRSTLAEFEERGQPIDPVAEIERARDLVWGRPA